MNRMLNYANRLNPIPGYICKPVFDKSDVVDKNSQLLDYIYGLDSNGLPTGDLSVYLGDKANPEVKSFIELNLLHENTSDGLSLLTELTNKLRETITDDDIAYFSRGKEESREEYADRLKLYFEKERQIRKTQKRIKEIERLTHGDS